MSSGWTQTKIVLDGFFKLLACGKCKKTPDIPIRYVTCGHFFCDSCIWGDSVCFQCKRPVRPNETQPYRTVAQLIEYCQIIKDVIGQIKPEDLKPLAEVVQKFAAEQSGVIPETESESENDIFDPRPLQKQIEEKNLESEAVEYIDSTQISEGQRKQDVESETVGYIEPTQFGQPNWRKTPTRKNALESETVGYIDPTPLNKSFKETNVELETLGFVDPTPASHKRLKQNDQLNTQLRQNPLDSTECNKKNNLGPESASYIDPTQISASTRNMDMQTEITDNINSKELNQHHKKTIAESDLMLDQQGSKTDLQIETAGFVDATPEKRHCKKTVPQTDSSGHVKSISPKNRCEEMESVENTGAAVEHHSTHESNGDLILAQESNDIELRSLPGIVIPESLQAIEIAQVHHDSGMETDETRTQIPFKKLICTKYQDETRNADRPPTKISKIPDSPMEIVEAGEETPLPQLKRIKSLTLNRRNKISTSTTEVSNDFSGQLMKNVEMKEIVPETVPKCDKTSAMNHKGNITSSNRDEILSTKETKVNEESEDFVEKTPPKIRRRKNSRVERQNLNPTTDSNVVQMASMKDLKNEILEMQEQAMTKRLSHIKQFAKDLQNKISSTDTTIATVTDGVGAPSQSSEIVKETRPARLKIIKNLKTQQDKTSVKKCKEKMVRLKARRGVDKRSTTAVPSIIPKHVNKRNAKGETFLHAACVKGQTEYVKALLEAGANPNTKDNAHWTPLQEAVGLGHREICKMLLQAGASANTPAMDNRTALHDAAANNKLEEATLLLRFNASREVYDKFGNRPIDYAVSDEMRALLTDENKVENDVNHISCLNTSLDQSILGSSTKIVVLPSDLSKNHRKLLAELAPKLKFEVTMSFRSTVSYVIVEANERNITKLTYHVMLAILHGKWILNSQWITISKDLNDISEIDLQLFEVRGAPNPETPTRARENEEKQNPRLFNNCFFYFAIGFHSTWNYEKFEFSKERLMTLVVGGEGKVLNREPDPEDVKDCKLTPFHVAHKPLHPLHRCSHYIIYMPGKDEPRVKYNMPHIKTLPLGWFLECIEKFALIDPALMGIS